MMGEQLYKKPGERVFFPNLNGLRFIAAFMVIFHHIEQFCHIFKYKNYWGNAFVENLGPLGVDLFFVLSGFLITYLLLVENKVVGKINIKQFYFRRIIRIWPLYFFIVLLSFFILPKIDYLFVQGWSENLDADFYYKLFLFVVMLPNIALQVFGPVAYCSQTWSIGVEEQFYLIWPLLISYFKDKIKAVVIFTVAFILLNHLLWYVSSPKRLIIPNNDLVIFVKDALPMLRFQCMGIGALFALVLFYEIKPVLCFFMNKISQLIFILLAISGIMGLWSVNLFMDEIYSFIFGVVILNLSASAKSIVNLEGRFINYLGKISYSLYMTHSIAIVISIKVCDALIGEGQSTISHVFVIILSILMTVFFSSCTYKFIESPFLRLRKRFANIQSGN